MGRFVSMFGRGGALLLVVLALLGATPSAAVAATTLTIGDQPTVGVTTTLDGGTLVLEATTDAATLDMQDVTDALAQHDVRIVADEVATAAGDVFVVTDRADAQVELSATATIGIDHRLVAVGSELVLRAPRVRIGSDAIVDADRVCFDGSVEVSGTASVASADIEFAGPVDGPGFLTLEAGGAGSVATFRAPVGSTRPLTSLHAGTVGTTTLAADVGVEDELLLGTVVLDDDVSFEAELLGMSRLRPNEHAIAIRAGYAFLDGALDGAAGSFRVDGVTTIEWPSLQVVDGVWFTGTTRFDSESRIEATRGGIEIDGWVTGEAVTLVGNVALADGAELGAEITHVVGSLRVTGKAILGHEVHVSGGFAQSGVGEFVLGERLMVSGRSTGDGTVRLSTEHSQGWLEVAGDHSTLHEIVVGDDVWLVGGDFGSLRIAGLSIVMPLDPQGAWRPITVRGRLTIIDAHLLLLAAAPDPGNGAEVVMFDNDGEDPVVGEFRGMPEGATVQVADRTMRITYVGGTGNDVAFMAARSVATPSPSPPTEPGSDPRDVLPTVPPTVPPTGPPTDQPPPVVDRRPPVIRVVLAASRSVMVRRGAAVRIPVRITCAVTEPSCTYRVVASYDVRVGRRTVRRVAGNSSRTLRGGRAATQQLTLSSATRAALIRAGKLRLRVVISATDADGNTSSVTKFVVVRARS